MNLISVLVSAGIMATLSTVAAASFKNRFDAQRHVELRGDKEAIRQMMLTAIDCEPALRSCVSPGQIIEARRVGATAGATSKPLISAEGKGSKFGPWTLRAECNEDLDGIVLRATRLSPTGTLNSTAASAFLADPMRQNKVKWQDDESLLFGSGITVCPSAPRVAWVPLNCTLTGSGYCAKYSPNVSLDDYCRKKGFANATARCKANSPPYGLAYGVVYNSDYYMEGGVYRPGEFGALCLLYGGANYKPSHIQCQR